MDFAYVFMDTLITLSRTCSPGMMSGLGGHTSGFDAVRSGRLWPVLGVVSASGVLQVSIYTVRPSWTRILDFIQFVTSKHVDLDSDLGDIP